MTDHAQRIVQFIALFILLIALSGCEILPSGRSRQTLPQSLTGPTPTLVPTPLVPNKPVYQVQRGEVVRTVEFLGRVAPLLEKELFFRTTGRVRNLAIKRDDFVIEGQVLADLEIADLERQLASAQLTLARAEQQLAQAEQERQDELTRAQLNLNVALGTLTESEQDRLNDLAEARIDLTAAKLALAKAEQEAPGPREVVAAADMLKARIALQQAQLAYDEVAFSADVGASAQGVALEQATVDFERAQANYELASQAIETYSYDLDLLRQGVAQAELKVRRLAEQAISPGLESDVALAQLELEILERGLDPLFQNNVERARLDVQNLEGEISEAQIVAPFDGQVLAVNITEGREAEPFKPIIIVADPTELDISATPLEAQLNELAENMPVVVEFSTRPDEQLQGFIRQLPYPYGGGSGSEGLVDEDDSTRISLETSLTEAGLALGDLMQIEVILEQKTDALWLPPQAIRTFEARQFVVVQDGELQERVDVTIGIESDDRVEIETGLSEGQTVLGP